MIGYIICFITGIILIFYPITSNNCLEHDLE